MIGLGKIKKVTAVLNFKLNFHPMGLTKYLLKVKITFSNTWNEVVDQNFGFFPPSLRFPLNFVATNLQKGN